ncbi:MAG TPA: hypothetical protein VMD59_20355, partial [Acidimicrobiales bacterium]|nr:hypothetical protein [Acidimicrobiales bacterium]
MVEPVMLALCSTTRVPLVGARRGATCRDDSGDGLRSEHIVHLWAARRAERSPALPARWDRTPV